MDITSWESYLHAHPDPVVDAFRKRLQEVVEIPLQFQYQVEGLVADFYFEANKLIVCVEGEAHDHSDGYYRHLEQLNHWRAKGFKVLTFPRFALEQDTEATLSTIKKELLNA